MNKGYWYIFLCVAFPSVSFSTEPSVSSCSKKVLTLNSPRLLLRALDLKDFELVKGLMTHPIILKISGDHFDEWVNRNWLEYGSTGLEYFEPGYLMSFGVYFQDNFIGKTLFIVDPSENVVKAGAGNEGETWVQIGYHFHPNHWGQGFGTEVVNTLVTFIFQAPEVDGVIAYTLEENQRSQNVLRKNGFKKYRSFFFGPKGEWERTLFARRRE